MADEPSAGIGRAWRLQRQEGRDRARRILEGAALLPGGCSAASWRVQRCFLEGAAPLLGGCSAAFPDKSLHFGLITAGPRLLSVSEVSKASENASPDSQTPPPHAEERCPPPLLVRWDGKNPRAQFHYQCKCLRTHPPC